MALVLNEEQHLLKSSAEAFFRERAPVTALRALRDTADPTGFSRDLWREMAAMGWAGTFLPEEYGGIGCGYTELGVVMQAAGRTLAASPLFATVALGASAVLLAGSAEQKERLLPAVAAGETLLTVALQEGPHHRPERVATSAVANGEGYMLSGAKTYVPDGHVADVIVVVARTAGAGDEESATSGEGAGDSAGTAGLSLFLVDREAAGVMIERRSMADSRNMAEVRLDGATGELLGTAGEAWPVIDTVIDRANAVLAAEMLGSAQAAFERTMEYLKTREQFGALIGTFQALQHRAAQMFCEIELSKSVVLKALEAIDADAPDAALCASLAKVQVSDMLRLVSDEAIQMHGGIGMTDEEDVGLYLKRARVAQQMLGDENCHLDRYARLRGY